MAGLALALLAAGPLAVNPNPCLRPELHLRCPDLVMRRPSHMHLARSPSGRTLLTSVSAIVNVGDGPLEIRGARVGEYRMAARQVLRAGPGGRDRVEPPTGTIDFYDTRTRGVYWKFRHAARFELWRLDADGRPVSRVRVGSKVDYCFRDLQRQRRPATGAPYPGSPRRPRFGACSQTQDRRSVTLGTSVGWADVYPATYPQNAIDVTGLRGCFAYVLKADPDNLLRESHERDNVARRTVRLPWRGPRLQGCPHVTAAALPGGG